MKATEVFISGGFPTVTYNPRTHLALESKLTEYIETGYKLISVTGPTKSGKTVLCKKSISQDNCISLSGGSISTENDVWESILNELNTEIDDSITVSKSQTFEGSGEIKSGIDLRLVKLGSKIGGKATISDDISRTSKKVGSLKLQAIKALHELNVAILIDDFHYINKDIQKTIIRAIKEPIFNGLRVIILAVPHRAVDSLRVESEMTGRVVQLPITQWEEVELKEVAVKGFQALNVNCDDYIMEKLAVESYGSPHLMQEFCLRLCKINNIIETISGEPFNLPEPNYVEFFSEIVSSISSKVAFERLAKGPRQRADRVQRELQDGVTVDIYEATLHAIAETGPKTEISFVELMRALRKVLAHNIPQGHEITRVLTKMDEIAKEELDGEPVIDWNKDNNQLYIADPFFAFYLKWAVRKVTTNVKTPNHQLR